MAHKYKVLDGSHIENGRTFKKGDTVVSHRDLTRFVGKFQDLGPVEEAVSRPERSQPPVSAPVRKAQVTSRR